MNVYINRLRVTYSEEFHSLSAAKRLMKQHKGSVGTITKVWANGEWEPMGKIELKRLS